jgi:hypothetical protein
MGIGGTSSTGCELELNNIRVGAAGTELVQAQGNCLLGGCAQIYSSRGGVNRFVRCRCSRQIRSRTPLIGNLEPS